MSQKETIEKKRLAAKKKKLAEQDFKLKEVFRILILVPVSAAQD